MVYGDLILEETQWNPLNLILIFYVKMETDGSCSLKISSIDIGKRYGVNNIVLKNMDFMV